MIDELTEKMHSELSVSEEDEIKLRTGCVWHTWCDKDSCKEDVEKYAKIYSVSYDDAMKWKDYWLNLYNKL